MRIKELFILLILSLILPLTALAQESITIGDTVEGTLDDDQPEVEYAFSAEQGQYLTITMTSSDSDIDPYLRLEDADGAILAEDDDSAGSLNARISGFSVPANGDYTVIATTLNGSGTGAFTLSLVTQIVNKIEYSQEIEGELTGSQSFVEYRFTGSAGDQILINMDSDNVDTRLSLASATDPSTVLISDDDGGVGSNAQIGPYELPETGSYVITASSYGGDETGDFTLKLSRVRVTPVELGGSVEGEMEGDTLFYTFEGRVGMAVSITVDSNDSVDTTLAVRGPDGYEIATDDDSGGRIDPEISSLVLTQDGTYTVMVQPYTRSEQGAFTIEISEYELPSLDDGPQTVRVSDKQTQQALTFTSVADETVRLSIVSEGGQTISPSVTITQAGTSISYISSSYVSEVTVAFTVPDDGTVNVQIDDYTYEQRSLTVTLERLNKD